MACSSPSVSASTPGRWSWGDGRGGRHEHLALGETPNIAARLEGLAPANTVVVSAVTARLVHGTFALDALGTHTLHGVAEPMAVSRVRGLLATSSRDEEFLTAGVLPSRAGGGKRAAAPPLGPEHRRVGAGGLRQRRGGHRQIGPGGGAAGRRSGPKGCRVLPFAVRPITPPVPSIP